MHLKLFLARACLLGAALVIGTHAQAIAQVTQPAAPADATAVTAKPIEPIVAPVQRVKPVVPKLDPRLSAQPKPASAKAANGASNRTKRPLPKVNAAAKPGKQAAQPAAKSPQPATTSPDAPTPAAVKAPAMSAPSQASPGTPPAASKTQ